LKSLFPYLNVEELKSARMVSRDWNEIATPVLKRKGMIYFKGHWDEEEPPPRKVMLNSFYRDIKNYLRQQGQRGNNFVVDSVCLGAGAKHTEQDTELITFFTKYGAEIKHLRLDYEYHSHFDVLRIRNYLTQYLPNLECFDIRNMPLAEGQMTKYDELTFISNPTVGVGGRMESSNTNTVLPVFWTDDAGERKKWPNLKKLEIWNCNAYVGQMSRIFVEDLIQAFPNLEEVKIVDRFMSKISNHFLSSVYDNPTWITKLDKLILDCCEAPTIEDLKILSQIDLKLKVLRLGNLPEELATTTAGSSQFDDTTSCFQTILNKQSPTLRELQFGNFKGNTPIRIYWPNFPFLETLELMQDISKAQQFNVTFFPVNYAKTFPRLKYLANCRSRRFYENDCMTSSIQRDPTVGKGFFRGMGDLWKSLFPEDWQVVNSLRILDIPYPKDSRTSMFAQRIAKMFPMVDNPSLRKAREQP
jgi:hypothetical protein